jgi:hypothetical protein
MGAREVDLDDLDSQLFGTKKDVDTADVVPAKIRVDGQSLFFRSSIRGSVSKADSHPIPGMSEEGFEEMEEDQESKEEEV